MRAPRRLDRTAPSSRRTLLLFALAVILPGFVLSVLGIVTLRQDRSLAEQQVRERRDPLADRVVALLEAELRGWGSALAASPLDSNPDPATSRRPCAPHSSDPISRCSSRALRPTSAPGLPGGC
jgi:hypothetical protein